MPYFTQLPLYSFSSRHIALHNITWPYNWAIANANCKHTTQKTQSTPIEQTQKKHTHVVLVLWMALDAIMEKYVAVCRLCISLCASVNEQKHSETKLTNEHTQSIVRNPWHRLERWQIIDLITDTRLVSERSFSSTHTVSSQRAAENGSQPADRRSRRRHRPSQSAPIARTMPMLTPLLICDVRRHAMRLSRKISHANVICRE